MTSEAKFRFRALPFQLKCDKVRMPASEQRVADLPSKRIRYESLVIIILLSVAVLSWSRRLSGPIDLRYDASTYFVLGTSLVEGKGYRLLNEPSEIEATQYPPFLPLIVAAHEWSLGARDLIVVGRWLRMTWFLSYIAFTLSVYFMLRQYMSLYYAFFGTLLCLLSLYTYLMSNQLAPEILFGLTTCLFFLSSNCSNRICRCVFSFLFATLSYALRTIGIALFVAWIAEAALQRRFRQALLRMALSLVPIICWQCYTHRVESSDHYKSPAYAYQRAAYLFYNVSYAKNIFALKDSFNPEEGPATAPDLAYRFLNNLKRVPSTIGQAVTVERKCWLIPFRRYFPRASEFGLTLLLGTIGCLVLGGIGLQLIRREWIMPLYVLISLAAICLTPWPIQLVRYFTPLCAFFAVAFVGLIRYFTRLFANISPWHLKVGSLSVSLLGSVILIHQLVVFYRFSRHVDRVVYDLPDGRQARLNVFGYFPAERAVNNGLDWLMKHDGSHGIVASSTPQWVYLRTGHKAVMPPFEINSDKAQTLLDSVPVTYLFLEESFTKKYVSAIIRGHSGLWKEVYSVANGQLRIYQRVDGRDADRTRPLQKLYDCAAY